RQLDVNSLNLTVSSPHIMPPLTLSESLAFGDISRKSILDIGTGCGIVALVAKKKGARYVLGIDIDEAAIANAIVNLKNNFPDADGVEFRRCDLYQCVNSMFDIIVSNPPYFKNTAAADRDYKYYGGDILDRMVREGKRYLNPGGE